MAASLPALIISTRTITIHQAAYKAADSSSLLLTQVQRQQTTIPISISLILFAALYAKKHPKESLSSRCIRQINAIYNHIKKHPERLLQCAAIITGLAALVILKECDILPDWKYTAIHWLMRSVDL